MIPIFIPSKDRAGKSNTLKILAEENIPHTVVIEPHESKNYAEHHPKAQQLVLPLSQQGLPYSRGYIIDNARKLGLDWIWMLDDDIMNFDKRIPGNRVAKTTGREALEALEQEVLKSSSIGQAGLEYSQFAWSEDSGKFHFNSYCDVCVLINIKLTKGINYRKIPLKEDRDFTLQVLASGLNTVRLATYSFKSPRNGSNEGGLYDLYKSGKETEGVKMMCELWKDVCTPVVKTNGRNDVKINWRKFKRQ